MASSGPNSPGTVESVTDALLSDWATPSNAASSNDSYATNTLMIGTDSEYLKATNFGFSIPGGATIDGIVCEIERKCDGSDTNDVSVKIVKGGTISGTDKSAGAAWPATDTYASFGGAADLWGLAWTDTDINASTFGFAIQCGTAMSDTASVDHMRITVHYTAAAGGNPSKLTGKLSSSQLSGKLGN